jgi:hypothetical protein
MSWKSRAASTNIGKGPDLWTKADTIAKFLSSVVIAVIGLLITSSIQRTQIATTKAIADAQMAASKAISAAQLDAARAKAEDDKRLHEGELAVQLMTHLISKEDMQRQIAVIALRRAVAAETYDQVVAVLAQNDPSSKVREAAITQLAKSPRPQVASTLSAIALNEKRPASERDAAGRAAGRVAFTMSAGTTKHVFGASQLADSVYEVAALQGGVFTYFLLRGLRGDADPSARGAVTARELSSFLAREVPAYTLANSSARQVPFYLGVGPDDPILAGVRPTYAVVVGISKYRDLPSLQYPATDARKIAQFLVEKGAKVIELFDAEATRERVLRAVLDVARSAPENADLIFYYGGHSYVDPNLGAVWPAYDSAGTDSSLIVTDIMRRLDAAKVHARFVFVDAALSGSAEVTTGEVVMGAPG